MSILLTSCLRIFNEGNETKAGTENQRDAHAVDGQVDADAVEQPELKGQAVGSFGNNYTPQLSQSKLALPGAQNSLLRNTNCAIQLLMKLAPGV